jgi:hypothetical protein
MFFSSARLGEVGVVVFYICVGSTVAELASDGWPAGGGAGRFFFDDTLVFVTIMMFCHCSVGMACPGRAVVFAGVFTGAVYRQVMRSVAFLTEHAGTGAL